MTLFRIPNYVGPVDQQCGSKLRYYDKATAKLSLRRLRGQVQRSSLHPYRCPHCGFWHLGNR